MSARDNIQINYGEVYLTHPYPFPGRSLPSYIPLCHCLSLSPPIRLPHIAVAPVMGAGADGCINLGRVEGVLSSSHKFTPDGGEVWVK